MSTNKKLYIENLILEVTRKCNMSCAHCMRGNAEELDLSFSTIQPLLDRLDGIGTITFTGGEPTLHIPVMKETLNYCQEKEIPIYNFYIVTNGKQISDEFLLFLLHLYQYCYEHNDEVNEFSGLALSKDDFHEPIPSKNQALLSAFTFYHPQEKANDFTKVPIVPTGRALSLPNDIYNVLDHIPDTYIPDITEFDDNISINDGDCYITAKGDITFNCNTSYQVEDKTATYTCQDIPAFLQALSHLANE